MKLYLVQHGLALSKEVDPGRPLAPEGEQDVHKVSDFLKQTGMSVNTVVHSGKMRAHQTADILAEAVLVRGEAEAINGIDPEDPVRDFALKASRLKYDTLVVGHLPFMGRLVSLLVTGQEEPEIVAFKPGSILCLQKDSTEHWLLQWMLRPDTL